MINYSSAAWLKVSFFDEIIFSPCIISIQNAFKENPRKIVAKLRQEGFLSVFMVQ